MTPRTMEAVAKEIFEYVHGPRTNTLIGQLEQVNSPEAEETGRKSAQEPVRESRETSDGFGTLRAKLDELGAIQRRISAKDDEIARLERIIAAKKQGPRAVEA